jgi:hypothetical protein
MLTVISLNAVSATGPGQAAAFDTPKAKVGAQVTVTGSPGASADINLEGSLDGVNFVDLGTIVAAVPGAGGSMLSFFNVAPILFLRANLTTINGSITSVTAIVAAA